MILRASAAFVLLLTAIASAQSTRPAAFVELLQQGKPQKIVYYGTSLTEVGAWSKQVTEALNKAFPKLVTTANAAKSGEQSRWGLANVGRVVKEEPDVVFIEFTTNDAVARFKLSVEEAKKNTEGIIDAILAARPKCQVILMTMNPVLKPKGDFSERVDLPAYEQMYRDLCKARGLVLVDNAPGWRTLLDKDEAEFKKLVPDGTHPNGPGFAKYVTPNVISTLGIPQK